MSYSRLVVNQIFYGLNSNDFLVGKAIVPLTRNGRSASYESILTEYTGPEETSGSTLELNTNSNKIMAHIRDETDNSFSTIFFKPVEFESAIEVKGGISFDSVSGDTLRIQSNGIASEAITNDKIKTGGISTDKLKCYTLAENGTEYWNFAIANIYATSKKLLLSGDTIYNNFETINNNIASINTKISTTAGVEYAKKLTTLNVGSTRYPVYFANGVPVQCGYFGNNSGYYIPYVQNDYSTNHKSGEMNIGYKLTFNNNTEFGSLVATSSGNFVFYAANYGNISDYSKYAKITAYSASLEGADLAEHYESDADYIPGTLIQFGGEKEITIAKTEVNAIISSNPGSLLNSQEKGLPIALCGRVPVLISGKVHKFDKIYLSKNNNGIGTAIFEERVNDTVIARALEEKNEDKISLVLCVTKFTL